VGLPESPDGVCFLVVSRSEVKLMMISQMHNRSPQSLLSDSILEYMNQVDRHEEDDLVRHFFRSQVQNLERILDIVFSTFRSSLSSADQRGDLSPWVLEVNRIFIVSAGLEALTETASAWCELLLSTARTIFTTSISRSPPWKHGRREIQSSMPWSSCIRRQSD
jgi:hypothetical protein